MSISGELQAQLKLTESVGMVYAKHQNTPIGAAWPLRSRIFATSQCVAREVDRLLRDGRHVHVFWRGKDEQHLRITLASYRNTNSGSNNARTCCLEVAASAVELPLLVVNERAGTLNTVRQCATVGRASQKWAESSNRWAGNLVPLTASLSHAQLKSANKEEVISIDSSNGYLLNGAPVLNSEGYVVGTVAECTTNAMRATLQLLPDAELIDTRIQASRDERNHREAPTEMAGAVNIWKEKLAFLLEDEAITDDASQRFRLKKQIEIARRKIQELDG